MTSPVRGCSISKNCKSDVYDVQTLRKIATSCGVKITGNKSQSDICDILFANAAGPNPAVRLKARSNRFFDDKELRSLRKKLKELHARIELKNTHAQSLDAERKAQLVQFLEKHCSAKVFTKKEMQAVLGFLHASDKSQESDKTRAPKLVELAQALLAKMPQYNSEEIAKTHPVEKVKYASLAYKRVSRAITFLVLNDLWPKREVSAEATAMAEETTQEFMNLQKTRLILKYPFLKPHLERSDSDARGIFTHIMKRWCTNSSMSLPSMDPTKLPPELRTELSIALKKAVDTSKKTNVASTRPSARAGIKKPVYVGSQDGAALKQSARGEEYEKAQTSLKDSPFPDAYDETMRRYFPSSFPSSPTKLAKEEPPTEAPPPTQQAPWVRKRTVTKRPKSRSPTESAPPWETEIAFHRVIQQLQRQVPNKEDREEFTKDALALVPNDAADQRQALAEIIRYKLHHRQHTLAAARL